MKQTIVSSMFLSLALLVSSSTYSMSKVFSRNKSAQVATCMTEAQTQAAEQAQQKQLAQEAALKIEMERIATEKNNAFIATICDDAQLYDVKTFLNVFVHEIPAMLADFDKAVSEAKKKGSYYESWVKLSEVKKNAIKKDVVLASFSKIATSNNGNNPANEVVSAYFAEKAIFIFDTAAAIYAPETKWSTTFASLRPSNVKRFGLQAGAVLTTALVAVLAYKTGAHKNLSQVAFKLPSFRK